MIKNKNSIIVNKIIDDIILEMEALFADKENLMVNIKMIKELTMVLKDLEKLSDTEQEILNEFNIKQKDEFLCSLFEKTKISVHNKAKKKNDKKRKI